MQQQNQLENFSKIEIETAKCILKNWDTNGFAENYNPMPIEGCNFNKDFNGKSVKQPHYKKCNFSNINFEGINGISSSFISCQIETCVFDRAGMGNSDFSGTTFLNNTLINNSTLSDCNFSNSSWKNTKIKGSNFKESFFINTIFEDSTFLNCDFEGAQFENCLFKNIDLTRVNLEYSTLKNVYFHNCILSFWGLLRSYNGLALISQHKDSDIKIRISASSQDISVTEFFAKLESLQAFFYEKNDFFVLSNVNIFFGNQDNALKYILQGLKYNLLHKDFRIIKYLCKLSSCNYFFDKKQLRSLYDILCSNPLISRLNHHEYQIYLDEMNDIKRILVDNPFSTPQMILTIKTNLEPDNFIYISEILKLIYNISKRCIPQGSSYVSIRKNSPPIFEIFASDNLIQLYDFYLRLSSLLLGAVGIFKAFHEQINSRQVVKKNKIDLTYYEEEKKVELDMKKESVRSLVLDNEKKRMDNEILKQQLNHLIERGNTEIFQEIIIPEEITHRVNSVSFIIRTNEQEEILLREFSFESEVDIENEEV